MIVMENAVVTYPSFELNCSLQVNEGTITGIVGENGAGKTTLFKALLGLVPIASGSAKINGQDIAGVVAGGPRKHRHRVGGILF